MAVLLLLAAVWLVPIALAVVQLRGLRRTGLPHSGRWALVGVVALYVVVIPVLTLVFWFAVLVFDCHGGYECPI